MIIEYHISQNNDELIRELQEEVYDINPSLYDWLKKYDNSFEKLLNSKNLLKFIDINSLKNLSQEYWLDIVRATLVTIGFGCENIYVFGSVASGETDKNSDIDLAVEGCPVGSYFKLFGKIISITDHEVDLVNLDQNQDKFAQYLKAREEGELIRVNKKGSSD